MHSLYLCVLYSILVPMPLPVDQTRGSSLLQGFSGHVWDIQSMARYEGVAGVIVAGPG